MDGWSVKLDDSDPLLLAAATEAAIAAAVPEVESFWDPVDQTSQGMDASRPGPVDITRSSSLRSGNEMDMSETGSVSSNRKGWSWLSNWLQGAANKSQGFVKRGSVASTSSQGSVMSSTSNFLGGLLGNSSNSNSPKLSTAEQQEQNLKRLGRMGGGGIGGVGNMVLEESRPGTPTSAHSSQFQMQEDPSANGFPRFPLETEKIIYRLSHLKLAQHRRPLLQQVVISNLMLYILSVHADVTLSRQLPRPRRKKGGRKKLRAIDPDGGARVPGRKRKKGAAQLQVLGNKVGAGGLPANGPLLTFESTHHDPLATELAVETIPYVPPGSTGVMAGTRLKPSMTGGQIPVDMSTSKSMGTVAEYEGENGHMDNGKRGWKRAPVQANGGGSGGGGSRRLFGNVVMLRGVSSRGVDNGGVGDLPVASNINMGGRVADDDDDMPLGVVLTGRKGSLAA
ncbi:hypothetical protein HDU76_010111 [Blyttiomyces sp. JEL0837]|nr:hypothetical protein HDU76_010111 [Blyttiomyces sp. JEL0837]